ncbi:Rv2175c family DNA-binding protein [Kytococcus sp. Marseille-QA3725]
MTDRPDLLDTIEWLTVPDLVERLGLGVSSVRQLVKDRELLGLRRGEGNVLQVPALFLSGDRVLGPLPGTITVLGDGGMTDEEIIRWLFEPDETLREGSAIADLHAGHKTEIRRRAAEAAW